MAKEIFVNRHYFVESSKGHDITCPYCKASFDMDNDDYPEDQLDRETGDVYCPKCDKRIIFEKSTEVTYTPIETPPAS